MSKIKFLAVAGVLSLVAIVLNISPVFVSKAEGDTVLQEIAKYRNWTKMTKEPLEFYVSGASGSE